MPYRFRTHFGVSGLQSVAQDWSSLNGSCDLWARFETYQSYATNLLRDDQALHVIQIFDENSTLAIVPVVLSEESSRFGRMRVLSIAASELPLTDFPLNQQADVQGVARCLIDAVRTLPVKWDVMRWRRIMHSSNALKVAKALRRAPVMIRPAAPSNSFDTTQPFQTLSQGFSKNIRASLRKSRKRMRGASPWRVDHARPEAAAFDEFLKLEASGWKGKSGGAIALTPARQAFFQHLLQQRAPELKAEVALLRLGENPIAAQFSVLTRGCRHILKVAYSEEHRTFSPGQVLLEEVLVAACATDSVRRVSLVTDMHWHAAWRPQREEAFEVFFFRHWLADAAFRSYLTIRNATRRAAFVARRRSN